MDSTLAHRVARRFQAELLSKPWLMGVRRGWLSLLKPQVHDFTDVFRAIGRLYQFVVNLRDQVMNVRQVIDKTDPKLNAAFSKLLASIEDAGSKAQHWSEAFEGKTISGPNERERADGAHMLNLYRTDFEGAIAGYKERGRGGLGRSAPLTEFLDDILKLLYAQAKRLEQSNDPNDPSTFADSVFREFSIGSMKIVVVDPKHHGGRIRTYVEHIERAHKELARKGFGAVWYGVLFLMSDSYEKLDKGMQEAYARAGYLNMEERAGVYHSGPDTIRVMAPPEDAVRVIVHEMGHRWWFKKMSSGQRARFESLLEGDWSMLHALLLNRHLLSDSDAKEFSSYFELVESGGDLDTGARAYVVKKFKELGLKAGVMPVSSYARSNVREAFAEVFEKYVMERTLDRDQVESFRSVLSSTVLRVARRFQVRCT